MVQGLDQIGQYPWVIDQPFLGQVSQELGGGHVDPPLPSALRLRRGIFRLRPCEVLPELVIANRTYVLGNAQGAGGFERDAVSLIKGEAFNGSQPESLDLSQVTVPEHPDCLSPVHWASKATERAVLTWTRVSAA
jgi:hypothetical protein